MAKKVQQSAESGKRNPKVITPAVAAISELTFQGVVIPHSWWITPHLRYDSGRSNVIAALILADICYWYRATETLDENGEVIARQRKFRSNKLHKSYDEWAELFGVTKRQVQNAIAFLVRKGLITRELRSFVSAGRKLGNVTFFEPVVDVIKALTFDTISLSKDIPLAFESDTSHPQKSEVSLQKVRDHTSEGETNTDTTQETSLEKRQRAGSVSAAANADTHAPPAASSSAGKKSKGEKPKRTEREGEEITLTTDQMAAYKIFLAFFSDLGAAHNFKELANFVKETNAPPGAAALMCAWLLARGRTFSFMRVALLRQLWSEYCLAPKEEIDAAQMLCGSRTEKMRAVMDEYRTWKSGVSNGA